MITTDLKAPTRALRELRVVAELISQGAQTGPNVVDALRGLVLQIERWRLLYLWEYLQFDAKAEPNRLIDAHQSASAAFREVAHDLKLEPLNPVEPAAMVGSWNASHP